MSALETLRPERVCLIKPSSLGDVVHALPTLEALRLLWPSARISWVVNRSLVGLLEGHPALDDVIPFDRGSARFSPAGLASIAGFARSLRSRRFDVAIDLQGLLRSGLMTWATGAPVRVGLAEAREGATRFYDRAIATPPGTTHIVEKLLAVAHAFGAPHAPARFRVACPEEDRAWARKTLAPVPGPRLVLNVGARWLTKRWPPAQFAEVALRAVETFGCGLVAVGAPEDRPLVDELTASLKGLPMLDLCGATNLTRLTAVLAEADLVLSNDTGPIHLAAAAGARVLGLFTCTSPAKTGPYGPLARSIQSCVWCAPSFVKTCARLECMAELSPDRVWSAVYPMLAEVRDSRTFAA
jgi:heptosyltransferase-1